jgi:hypothetical protein
MQLGPCWPAPPPPPPPSPPPPPPPPPPPTSHHNHHYHHHHRLFLFRFAPPSLVLDTCTLAQSKTSTTLAMTRTASSWESWCFNRSSAPIRSTQGVFAHTRAVLPFLLESPFDRVCVLVRTVFFLSHMATPLVQESVKKCDTISSLPNNGDDPARTNNVWSARDGAWMPPQRAPRFAKKVLGSREAVCSSMPGLKTMTRSDAVRDVPSSLCLTKSQCPCSAACLLIYDEHTCDSSRALTHAHAHAHLHMHTHTRARTHTHTRARTHTPHEAHTHTHTHTHTH